MHTALIENYLFGNSLIKKANMKKDKATNKALANLQFQRIDEFYETIRTTRIANTYPNIFKSPFKPCINTLVYFITIFCLNFLIYSYS